MKLKNDRTLAKYATTGQADQSGYLVFKRSDRTDRPFVQYWFVLKGNMFFYFEKKNDREPIGVIILEGCSIEVSDDFVTEKYMFKINFPTSRIYYLAAETQEIMELWMLNLSRSSFYYLLCTRDDLIEKNSLEITTSVDSATSTVASASTSDVNSTYKKLHSYTSIDSNSSQSSNSFLQQQQQQQTFIQLHQAYGLQFDFYLKQMELRSGKESNVSAQALLDDLLS